MRDNTATDYCGRQTSKITLKNVIHTPDALFNLISISHAIEAGVAVLFSSPGVRF